MIQAVKRNNARFPEDFVFQLTSDEFENLKSQIVISSLTYGGDRHLPYAFTEHGIAMLSSVLRSDRAVQMNIFIVRAFVKMRQMLANHAELAKKIDEIERKQQEQGDQLSAVYSIIKQLIEEPLETKDEIGFRKA